jgi:hypothetical protein
MTMYYHYKIVGFTIPVSNIIIWQPQKMNNYIDYINLYSYTVSDMYPPVSFYIGMENLPL